MRCLAKLLVIWASATIAESTAIENQCKTRDGECVADDRSSSNGYSMLNLGMRMHSKVDVKEYSLALGNGSVTGKDMANLSEISTLRALVEQPGSNGLPGNVVITTVTVKCGDQVFSPMGDCPAACPFFTSIVGQSCYFKCVTASQCGSEDPSERIPDKSLGVCRECNVQGCMKCAPGQKDACSKCAAGYELQNDGTCSSDYALVWKYIFIFLAVVFGFLFLWLIQLGCAPVTNRDGLREGLEHRTNLKLHVPVKAEAEMGMDPSEELELYPLSTNLHVTNVAGPGLLLHMNFQLASILWACTLIVVWLCFVYMTDARQLTIGLFPAETKPQLCYVTLQGRALQEEQMSLKVFFIALVYLITFIGSLGYACLNQKVFDNIADETGMEDFVAVCSGLPPIKGSDHQVEQELKACLENATGERLVGVSILWDYASNADKVYDILDKDMVDREPFEQPTPDPDVYDSRGSVQKAVFNPVDNLVGGVLGLTIPDTEEEDFIDPPAVVEMLNEVQTTSSAFIVFETEESRDRGIDTMKSKEVVAFKGGMLKIKKKFCEPKMILWENFNIHWTQMCLRVSLGIVLILVALVIYSLCFYLPYAYYQSMFKFPNEPGAVEGIIFSMLVVAGNQIMYQVCAAISDGAGFHYKDDSEALYVSLYVLAVLLSVFFDMSMEFYLGYHSMADAHVRTADGRPLNRMTSFQEIFESYPMQKVLGKRLFDYCFPATFTVPFLVEPIGTVMAPFLVQRWLLRTHPEVRGRNAEKSVEFFCPMDLGRYGDILLNILLVALILFFPSGIILPILLTYVVSAVYVYCYDHYKVLRCVPNFDYGTDAVDKYTQLMLILPCATLAAVLVFKANCVWDSFCYSGYDIAMGMLIAFAVHTLVHLMLLKVMIPLVFSTRTTRKVVETYSQVAAKEPCTWFNANPVHCLRSIFIHKDNPSCCYWIQGKEHLIKANPKIGQHFFNSKKSVKEEW